ncbi:MAG: matrixin family metalloprotease [Chloroflexi bacterium]|nr:matrixin family metalloprotease [Chloroflexota bacterium]
MKKSLTIALALTVVIAGALVITQSRGEGHAATESRLASVFGVKETRAGDLIIHITLFVPPGVNERVVADAALNAQRARPATPADLQSADFTTTGLVWDQFSDGLPGNVVTQNYNDSKDPTGVDGLSVLTNTQATWSAVSTSSFVLSFGGLTNRCPSLLDECQGPQTFDGFNDVTFFSLAGPCNFRLGCTLGVTWYSTSVDEADVALNTKVNWVHDCKTAGPAFDAESVLLHEIGHVVGLGHSPDVNAVMATPYLSAQCDLDQDDINGISALYPGTGATPVPTAVPAATPVPTPTPIATPSPTPSGSNAIVDDVSYATEGGKNKDKHLLITVALVDDLNDPVSGASVSIELFRDSSWIASATGTTGAGGTVTFSLKNASAGCYTTDVTNVDAAGLTWDGVPLDNVYDKGGESC